MANFKANLAYVSNSKIAGVGEGEGGGAKTQVRGLYANK